MSERVVVELFGAEAVAYEAWRRSAADLLAITQRLHPMQASIQEAQTALDREPTDDNAATLLHRTQQIAPVRELYTSAHETFRAALQALTNLAAPASSLG